ncbi:hypothetical protein SGGMMB4_03204 [Sodalis glossinidius str. 'morsitans']|uniref:Uncharacterized protein n=1 Tax=Sodalis glossinidius (strain morsitans) TaxID=343509 RepID=A0A193QKL3_SODGM|nr:hypothetical protein [Sodalis glossinidius]CRL45465.1 hypothetical protein SGGMMB4_03204 [Sodalis glossinidius str. 'morsitans']
MAIEALGSALKGSTRLLLVTTGLAHLTPGRIATEQDAAPTDPRYPCQSEAAAIALAEQGVRVCIVRLEASVHGSGDHGFIAALIRLAREKGYPLILVTARTSGPLSTVRTPRSCIDRYWSKPGPTGLPCGGRRKHHLQGPHRRDW